MLITLISVVAAIVVSVIVEVLTFLAIVGVAFGAIEANDVREAQFRSKSFLRKVIFASVIIACIAGIPYVVLKRQSQHHE